MLIKSSSEMKIASSEDGDDEVVEIKPQSQSRQAGASENEICVSDDASSSLARHSPIFESDSEELEEDAVLSECEVDEDLWEDR